MNDLLTSIERFVEGPGGIKILTAILLFVGLMIAIHLFVSVILRRLDMVAEKAKTRVPVIIIHFLRTVPGWVWLIFSLGIALQLVEMPPRVEQVITAVLLFTGVVFGVRLLQQLMEYLVSKHVPRFRSGEGESVPALLHVTLGFILWVLGILLVLSNLGINVTSLLTGLGIGGIAIALAMQNILGDIFSSFSLWFDQPFKEGDFIVTGTHSGTVKKIGLKTTRVQALQGEEIVISNQELTQGRVQNFKKLRERRVQFTFAVRHGATREQLQAIPGVLQTIIGGQEKVRFDRAHLKEFTDAGFLFEVVYFVETDEYLLYMNAQQAINFAVLDHLTTEGLQLGTTTRYIISSDAPDAKTSQQV